MLGPMPTPRQVCVFCASSRLCDERYTRSARRLGADLARRGVTLVYGGGSSGLMGAVADGALAEAGKVIGVLPRFMDDLEWGHRRLTELRLVDSMEERLRVMLDESDAFVALPGGCGTLEEIFFVLSRKRLGLHGGPVILVNVGGYFDPCIEMLRRCVAERFMDERHAAMWSVVAEPEAAYAALEAMPTWTAASRGFAVP
jgi:uncharacterized protein (TIGR00730 family)